MKRFDKKGQFYIVAAMILVIVVSSIVTINNYSSKKEFTKEAELRGKELVIESERVLDYDSANNQENILTFAEGYSNYLEEEADIIFIYGEEGSLDAFTYEDGGYIDLNSGLVVDNVNGTITFTRTNEQYQFNLNRGKNFYFILSKEAGSEKYVYTN